ncbi:MAG: hypothetical protein ACLR7J_12355 [[Ruminococcus] torques]
MHSEKFKLDFRTKMLMSLCLSYTLILGNIQTKFSIVAAAYSLLPYVFLLLNREKKAAVKGILFIMAAYIIQKEWVFSAGGFLGIFISFYYDDVFAASSGICDGEICSCFIYNEPYDVSA